MFLMQNTARFQAPNSEICLKSCIMYLTPL